MQRSAAQLARTSAVVLLVGGVLAFGYARFPKSGAVPSAPATARTATSGAGIGAGHVDVSPTAAVSDEGGGDEWDGDPNSLDLPMYEGPASSTAALPAWDSVRTQPVSREEELKAEAMAQVVSHWRSILRQCEDMWWYYQPRSFTKL